MLNVSVCNSVVIVYNCQRQPTPLQLQPRSLHRVWGTVRPRTVGESDAVKIQYK